MDDTLRYDTNDTTDTTDTYRTRFLSVSYRIASRIISYRVCIASYRIVSYRMVFASCLHRVVSFRMGCIVSYRIVGRAYRIVSYRIAHYDAIRYDIHL